MGVVLYGIVIGHLPFSAAQKGTLGKEELLRHAKIGLTLTHEKHLTKISSDCRHILHHVLDPDPTKRISLGDLVTHLWVTDGGRFPLAKPAPLVVPKGIREQVIDKVSEIYNSSPYDVEQHLKKCQYDARGAVYQLLLDQAIADLKRRASIRGSSVMSNRRRSSARSMQVYREQKPSKKLYEDSIKIKRKGQRKEKKRSDLVREIIKELRENSSIVDEEDHSIVKGKTNQNPSNLPMFSSVKIVDWTDTLKIETRDTNFSTASRKPPDPSPSCTRGWSRSKGPFRKDSPIGKQQRVKGKKITTKRTGLGNKSSLFRGWQTDLNTDSTQDTEQGQPGDHFFMLPSRDRSDIRSKTPICTRVVSKKPPTLASGFRVRSLSACASRKYSTSIVKNQTKSFHSPDTEKIVCARPRSRSLDIYTPNITPTRCEIAVNSECSLESHQIISGDVNSEACDVPKRNRRSKSQSSNISSDTTRISVPETSSKGPIIRKASRPAVSITNKMKLGGATDQVVVQNVLTTPAASDSKKQTRVRFGGGFNRRMVGAFDELGKRNPSRGERNGSQIRMNVAINKVADLNGTDETSMMQNYSKDRDTAFQNAKAIEHLKNKAAQEWIGIDEDGSNNCKHYSSESLLDDIGEDHNMPNDQHPLQQQSDTKPSPGFRRYVKYFNRQRNQVLGILKKSSSINIGNSENTDEDRGKLEVQCKASPPKRVTFKD